MKVQGNNNPGIFSVEENLNKPRFMLARFYENIVEIESGYEYDEYHLELFDTGNLEKDIEGNFEAFLNGAKIQAGVPIIETPTERRKHAYMTLEIIEWFEDMLTVDGAVLIATSYYHEWLAEHATTELIPNDHILHKLQLKIHEAKEQIREMFPDK